MENYASYNIKVKAPCPNDRLYNCQQDDDKLNCDDEYKRSPYCLFNDDGTPINGISQYYEDNLQGKMCEYDINLDEHQLEQYAKAGHSPNLQEKLVDGEHIDVYDPNNVIGDVVTKLYDYDMRHENKEQISSFERIIIITGIVLFSLLIIVSGLLLYKNIRKNSISNNVRANINNLQSKISNISNKVKNNN